MNKNTMKENNEQYKEQKGKEEKNIIYKKKEGNERK